MCREHYSILHAAAGADQSCGTTGRLATLNTIPHHENLIPSLLTPFFALNDPNMPVYF